MSRQQMLKTLWTENRAKILLLVGLLLLIVALHLFQALWLEQKFDASREQLLNTQKELRLAQQRMDEGSGAKISGIAEDLEKFYEIIPEPSGLGSFIGRLYSYAGDAGIDIAQVSYQAKSIEDSRLFSYQLNFGVSGSYLQLKKFIHLLENSPALLIIDRISLSSSQQETTGNVGLQMELKTFFKEGGL
jgi:type IV pilus assembly protein PilO